jgi:hypothetical protein
MADPYTKVVLTVIAVALVFLCAQQLVPTAVAQMGGCRNRGDPCDVPTSTTDWFCVKVLQ